jgi:hypothetical protein
MSRRPTPTAAEAFDAFCTLLVFVAAEIAPSPATSKVYTADDLPPDATSRDAFLRLHRARMKERAPGWTRRGKVRAVTFDAWERDVERETAIAVAVAESSPARPAPPVSIENAMRARLGLVVKGSQ